MLLVILTAQLQGYVTALTFTANLAVFLTVIIINECR